MLNHWCPYRYAFATLLSLYNKWMFSPQYYNFQYPLFVTACHMIVQFALAALIRIIWADKFRPKERPMRVTTCESLSAVLKRESQLIKL